MRERPSQARKQIAKVRRFYERESERYVDQRYGTSEPWVARPYLERLPLILEWLDGAGGRALDVGCGPGILLPHLLDRGHSVVAVDLSANMLTKARKAVEHHPAVDALSLHVASADQLPLRDETFDLITCIGVLSYLPSADAAISELARLLRPGGVLVLQASNLLAPWEIENRFFRYPYHRLYSALTGKEIRDRDFALRPLVPWRLDARLRRAGLVPVARRHYDFRVPFLPLANRNLAERLASRLMRFSRSRVLGLLGTGYLVKAVRDGGR